MSTLHFKWLKKQYSESDISEQYIGSKFFSKKHYIKHLTFINTNEDMRRHSSHQNAHGN